MKWVEMDFVIDMKVPNFDTRLGINKAYIAYDVIWENYR